MPTCGLRGAPWRPVIAAAAVAWLAPVTAAAQLLPLRPGLTLTYVHRNFDKDHDSEFLAWVIRRDSSETVFGGEFIDLMNTPGRATFEDHMSRREFVGARDVDYGRGGHVADFPEHRPHTLYMLSQRLLQRAKSGETVEMIMPIVTSPGSDILVSGTARGVAPMPDTQEVVIDGRARRVPTVHLRGDFLDLASQIQYTADLWFLDDTAAAWITRDESKMVGDERTFHMVLGPVTTPDAPKMMVDALEHACRAPIYGFYFAFNSAAIGPASASTFEAVAGMLRGHPDWAVTIEGHTDSIGRPDANRVLSEQRAAAVTQELVSHYGIAATRLTPAGAGATGYVAPNSTLLGRARNRRVDLVRRCGA
jgi:hypothetical protein